jgi:hypothetical protein
MTKPESIPLTSSELGYLWTGYAINEMSTWFLTVFGEQAIDEQVRNLYTCALQDSRKIVAERKQILGKEGFSIPSGFSEKDIRKNAPSLFTDRFLLSYLHVAVTFGLEFHSRALGLSTRTDIRDSNRECLHSSIQLNEKVIELLLNKGLYWRTPSLPPQNNPEKIQKESYLNGWLGDKRPINSIEMANLYFIIDILNMMETLLIGFAQITSSEDVKDLIQKGIDSVKKQFNALVEIVKEDNLPFPSGFSMEVTVSKEKIFSDRILVTHLSGLMGSLLSQYGYSLGSSMKHDLVKAYTTQLKLKLALSQRSLLVS